MFRTRNTRITTRTRTPRVVLGLLATVLLAIAPARARAAVVPDASQTIEAFDSVRARLLAWGDGPAIVDPDGATGACLTLRLGGRVLGRATSMDAQGAAIENAFAEAWAEALDVLSEGDEQLTPERREAIARRTTIDLEVSGELRPILAATYESAGERISPGLEGVAMREGSRVAGVFPGFQLATGLTPTRALRVAVGRLDLPPVGLERLRVDRSVVVYGFRGLHLAQARSEAPAQFLHRGDTIVSSADVSSARLREAAAGIAAHLRSHVWSRETPIGFGLHGAYEPATGRYEPMIAEPRAQALAAFALLRFSRTPGIDEADAEAARTLGGSVLRDLTIVEAEESDPGSDPIAASMWLVGWSELVAWDELSRNDETFSEFARIAFDSVIGAIDDPERWNTLPEGARALVAHALVRADEHLPGRGARERARTVVRRLFVTVDPARLTSLMPWIGWAELRLAGDNPVPAEIALREFRDLVWQFRVDEPPGHPNADLSGGIVFTRGGAALPTWHTFRPLAFIATMIARDGLTDDEELGLQVASLRPSLRYLLQLTLREPGLFLAVSETRALGGVRNAMWDPTLDLDANAMALLTLCETLRAVAIRSARGSDPQNADPLPGP